MDLHDYNTLIFSDLHLGQRRAARARLLASWNRAGSSAKLHHRGHRGSQKKFQGL